jgi:membrane-bound lytic murein transglycosylase MltF
MKQKTACLISLLVILIAALTLWLTSSPKHPAAPVSEERRITEIESILPLPKAWSGDLDGMLERRLLRVLVPYSKTLYFQDQGQARGIVHDSGVELEKWLNRKHGNKTLPIRVIFIPTARTHLLQDLIDGHGDIAAGNLTITPEREKIVDFTETGGKDVSEIVVTGPSAPEIHNLTDLGGMSIYVRRSSSYYEHLIKLQKARGIALKIIPADEILEDEDLLEMVNAGLLPMAIVDDHKARFWAQFFDEITLREDLSIHQGGMIAWAIRKNSPLLTAELNEFGRVEGRQKGLTNMLLKRYLGSTRYVSKSTSSNEIAKFNALSEMFKKYAEMYALDHLLLMAQGYQESRLDQSVRSRAGAVGIMQILPSTAASAPVGMSNIENDIDENIHAGAKYMRYLIDTYLNDPGLDERNRLLLGLAAYNAGPGNLKKIRQKTTEMGLNRDIWFNNVEHGSAQVIGRETTQYVSNIYKYYLAYRLIEERQKARRNRISTTPP